MDGKAPEEATAISEDAGWRHVRMARAFFREIGQSLPLEIQARRADFDFWLECVYVTVQPDRFMILRLLGSTVSRNKKQG